jgi:hypothetical protein
MREAINQNRTVQIALVLVLALAGGFIFLKVGKGSGSPTSSAATPTPGAVSVSGSGTAGDSSAVAPDGTTFGATAGSPAPTVPANLLPGSGLPKSLLAAYQRGDAVALLVMRAGGTDDGLVHHSLGRLASLPRLSVFVTKAKEIARYAWLTQGVDVTELPALVILRPRGLTNGVPTASVSYGFRDGASVVQAAKDALYNGASHLPDHP